MSTLLIKKGNVYDGTGLEPVTADIYNSQKAVWEAAYIPVSYAGCGQGHSLNETNIEKMLENIQNVMPKKSN